MLKIKDNVDLKELEKFGFVKWERKSLFKNYVYVYDCKGETTNKIYVYTNKLIRIVNINKRVISLLYDLIKADLVEKVDE